MLANLSATMASCKQWLNKEATVRQGESLFQAYTINASYVKWGSEKNPGTGRWLVGKKYKNN